jgi:hypothetical protein
MNPHSKIEVVDKDGWRKTYPLEKSITYIGSQVTNDIVLESGRGMQVDPLHAQLIAVNGNSGYQLVNLATTDILLGSTGDQTLPPRSVLRLNDEMIFRLGDFTLVFRSEGTLTGGSTSRGASQNIGLNLSLPQPRLAPNQSLEGIVTVQNRGQQPGAQFELDLEGMDPECYDIEPGPLLSSGAEKDVFFRLHHRGAKPLAGTLTITIRAKASRAYPAEEAVISKDIEVLPFYRHSLRLISPDRKAAPSPAEPEALLPKAKASPLPQGQARAPSVPAGPPAQTETVARPEPDETDSQDWWSTRPPVAPAPALATERPVPQSPRAAAPRTGEPETLVIPTPPPIQPGLAQPTVGAQPQSESLAEPVPPVMAPPSLPAEEAASPQVQPVQPVPEAPSQVKLQPEAPAQPAGMSPTPAAQSPDPDVRREQPSTSRNWWSRLAQFWSFSGREKAGIEASESVAESTSLPQPDPTPRPQAIPSQIEAERVPDVLEDVAVTPAEAVDQLPAEPEAPAAGHEEFPVQVEADSSGVVPEPKVAPAALPEEVQPSAEEPELVQGEEEEMTAKSETHSTEPEPADDSQVHRFEAHPSSGRAVEQGTEPAEVEDWWSAEPEPDHLEQSSERKVLKLKARPQPTEEPAEKSQADVSPEAEDWWTADETAGS